MTRHPRKMQSIDGGHWRVWPSDASTETGRPDAKFQGTASRIGHIVLLQLLHTAKAELPVADLMGLRYST